MLIVGAWREFRDLEGKRKYLQPGPSRAGESVTNARSALMCVYGMNEKAAQQKAKGFLGVEVC